MPGPVEKSEGQKKTLMDILGCEHPILMAPMFLVTNNAMMIAGLNAGIAVCIPALNYWTPEDLEKGIKEIRAATPGKKGLGINLIVNKANIKMPAQLKKCVELGVDFFITSLGSPEPVIKACKGTDIKVFCDVVDA